jgi:glycosyltransferase involved in cell wall biosynthesis
MLKLSDLNEPSGMYSDLIMEFVRTGHEVFPVAAQNKGSRGGISLENNIPVLRVGTMPLFNVDNFIKGLANILLPFQYRIAYNRHYENLRPDLVIVATPPVTLARVIKTMKNKYNSCTYLILRDIFPQNAVDLGMMKNGSLIYRYFRHLEKMLYKYSDSIGCMSEGNIKYIVKHNPDLSADKLHLLMNFQKLPEPESISQPEGKDRYGLSGKFVVVFGGNMGLPQKIENVLELARRCMVHSDVLFLFLGDGTQREKIEYLANLNGINNVRFKNTIPRDDYIRLVRVCDIGLISLNEKFTIPNFPSKTMAYFAAGIPVLAAVDKATDYGEVLQNAQAGLVSEAGEHEVFYRNFVKLYESSELRISLGENGRKFFLEHMTSEIACKTIMAHV